MRLASLKNGTLNSQLVLVSKAQYCVPATGIAPDLISALRCWNEAEPGLRALYERLENGSCADARPFDPRLAAAPLPIAPQWCDGSAFLHHGDLMDRAFNLAPNPDRDRIPLVYQGASDDFLGPCDDVPLPSEADGIDFEGEFGVVVDDVPMGVSPDQALGHIRLLVQINDWSLRALGPREMKAGFGFLQAKPSTAFAPFAVTPDELGSAWQNGRIAMQLHVECNGTRFGQVDGAEMHFHFGELIAHVARTRRVRAGSIIGSGTVSNVSRSAGSSCIAERRVIEMLDEGEAKTPFMHFGDRVRMQACFDDGSAGPFGAIDQRVIASGR